MQAELFVLSKTNSKMLPLFNLNLKPTVGTLIGWVKAYALASRQPMKRGMKISSAIMTSQLVLTGSPYKGGSKYEPDTFSLVHPPHMETISPSESDSLADTDSDSTLNNESIGSSSKWSLHDCDSNLKLVKSGSSRDPLPLVDSQVFTFSTYSPAHWCTDDLDFWCAGEDRKLLRRCSLSYGARSLRNARTRSCSMPCRSSLIKESHPSIFGTGAPPEYTVSRAPRVASSGNAMNRRKIKGVVSNKWGNNPPAGYI